jgi:hypothetical protein
MNFSELFEFNLANITNDSIVVSLVGYLIVFLALILLYIVFNNIPKIIKYNQKRRLRKKGAREEIIEDLTITGEVSAAISTAIHLYFDEIHDEEATVLTVQKISKRYAPWSSKIYNVTTGLNRRF